MEEACQLSEAEHQTTIQPQLVTVTVPLVNVS